MLERSHEPVGQKGFRLNYINVLTFTLVLVVHSIAGAQAAGRALVQHGETSRPVEKPVVQTPLVVRAPAPAPASAPSSTALGFRDERAGSRPQSSIVHDPGQNGADPGSNGGGAKGSDCEGAYFAKLTLAAAAGSCAALDSAPNSPGGSSACGNPMAANGQPGDKAEYDQGSHAPEVAGAEVGAKNNATDCSGVPCQAWIAQGFMPEGKPMGAECPNSDAWVALAEKGSQCLQKVENETEYKVGDLRCGPTEGGVQGHCAFVCDQKDGGSAVASNFSPFTIVRSLLSLAFPEIANAVGGGVKPTSDVSKITLCEAVGKDKGWTLTPGTSLLNTKLQNPKARTLRPVLKSEKPECYGPPKEVKNDDAVKQCKTLPKVAHAK